MRIFFPHFFSDSRATMVETPTDITIIMRMIHCFILQNKADYQMGNLKGPEYGWHVTLLTLSAEPLVHFA
jgi:hypothetical protein